MKTARKPSMTAWSRIVPTCAINWTCVCLLLGLAGCLNPMPDDYPLVQPSDALAPDNAPPLFGGPEVESPTGDPSGAGAAGSGSGPSNISDDDISPPAEDPSPEPDGVGDAGAPPPDGGSLQSTSRLRPRVDAGFNPR